MGLLRKALVVSTGGLAGLVLKESSPARGTAKSAPRPARARGSRSVKQGAKATRQSTAKAARPAAAKAAAKARRPAAAKAAPRPAAKVEPAPAATAPVTARERAPAAGSGTIGELERLADLHGRGALTGAEFAAAKAKILGTAAPPPPSASEPAVFPAIEANVAAARHLADLTAFRPSQSIASSGD